MVINKIKDSENKIFFEKIIIVIESTGMYSFNPTCYLSSFAIYFLYENIIFYIVYKKKDKMHYLPCLLLLKAFINTIKHGQTIPKFMLYFRLIGKNCQCFSLKKIEYM